MDAEIEKQFQSLKEFIIEHTVTKDYLDEQLELMKETMVTKDDINRLQTSVDGIGKSFNHHNAEIKSLDHRVGEITDWVRKAAGKIGIDFKQ